MVFESVVVDLLNRVLGDYFENLDTSQLKLGIWGGDVVLKDLMLKTSVMDDLGLPFKVVIGKLGVLTVKIPWQSLYTAPVELNLQRLFLLVVPSHSVVYNDEAEEAAAQAAKQKELSRIDEIRKREQQKKAGPVDPVADTFAEKLITQIIKNVQIRIESIHVRYEDSVTNPNSPFAFGAVLKSLHVQTTDKNWKLAIITETVNIIYKMAKLEGLSVYWNSKSSIISKLDSKPVMLDKLQALVDSSRELTYVLGPISSEAKVKLTPSPERGDNPFSESKFVIDVLMEELAIGLTNMQFQDAMTMAEAMDAMSRAQHYRKYRPKVMEHKGHYKEWWKFAYRCVVEEDVRRRQLNWDWSHIKNHRRLVKIYADVYYQKLMSKKVKADLEAKVLQCEKALDVFNITLIRKQVEMKVERQGHKDEAAKPGWFSGWFGGSSSATQSTSMGMDDIAKKLEEALTPDEKRKLYQAIDYTEGALPVDFPEEYLEYKLKFNLKKLKCVVREVIDVGTQGQKILDLEIANVENLISTRPVRNGLNLSLDMGSIEAVGVQRGETQPPHIISSKSAGQDRKLIEIEFKTNPLHSTVSQRLNVKAAPVEVVYHAVTVVELVKCFTLPPEIQLSKLQAATVATLNEWREQSAASLQHLIDTRGEVDINVDLTAPYLLIPEGGTLERKGTVLVLDLGEIHLKTKPRQSKDFKAETSGKTKEEVRQLVVDRSYDSFLVTLSDFQVLLALPDDNYRSLIGKGAAGSSDASASSMHLIKSNKFTVQLDQCLVQDDPSLPKLKIAATLPLLDLSITEERLLELLKLLVTLPFPQSEPTANISHLSYDANLAESVAISRITYSEIAKKKQELAQFIEMKVFFTIMSIRIRIMKPTGSNGAKKWLLPIAEFELKKLEAQMTNKTFGTDIGLFLGGLALCASNHSAPGYPPGQLYLLKTPMTEGHLFNLHMFSVSADCPPKFASKVKQELKVNISTLDVILHQEALHTILNFVTEGIASFNRAIDYTDSKDIPSIFVVKKVDERKPNEPPAIVKPEAKKKVAAKKNVDSKDVLLSFQAHMNRLTVQLSTEEKNLMKLVLGKLDMSFEQRPKKSTMAMELTEFQLLNLDPKGFYKTIISQENDKMINVQCVMYEAGTKGKDYLDMTKYDMKIRIETGSPRIVYLSPFVQGVMNFVDNFQVAKDAVVENVAAAAEVARENVEQAYSSGTRVLIDVQLKTPHIVIPRNAHSSSALLAYLGNLSVKNAFKRLKGSDASDVIIVDEIHTVLEDMKMSRIIVDKQTQKTLVECLMLDPVTLRVSVLRNLSCDWYKEIPEIEIKGEMESTFIKCSSEDYQILMACLTENISASTPAPPQPAAAAVAGPQMITTVAVIEEKKEIKLRAPVQRTTSRRDSLLPEIPIKVTTDGVHVIVPPTASEDLNEVFCKLRLELIIKETGLILYTGSTKLEGERGLVQRDAQAAFANFRIENINITNTMWSNENLNCIVKIHNMILHDIRPGEREITNLIYRKSESATYLGPDSHIVKITFRTDAAGKQGSTLNVETLSLSFVLCVDYLTLLAAFITTPGPVEAHEHDKKDLELKYETFTTSGDPGPVREITTPVVKPRRESRRESVEDDQPLQIYFSMAETDVILVETMEKADTNALLLNCEVSVKVVIASKKTNMMATINKVRLNTCTYDPDLRSKSLAEVISPMSVTVVLNTSPLTGTLIDVNISDIFLRLTAGTLELLLKISSGMGTSSATVSLTEFTGDYSDIWDIKDNSECNLWFLKPESGVELGVDALAGDTTTRLFDLAEDLVVQERLILESGCIVLTFETGSSINSTPILLIETDIDLQIFDWSTRLQMAGRMKLEAAYYNALFGMWEFLIEPVETRHHGKVSHRPWELFIEYTTVVSGNTDAVKPQPTNAIAARGHSDEDLVGAGAPPSTYMAISFQSNDILELTVTKTAMDVLTLLSEDFQEAVKSLVSQKEVSTSAYTVVNDSGLDIKLNFLQSAFALVRKGVSYEEALLRHGTTLSLGLVEAYDLTKHHTSILKEQEGREERLLNMTIEEFNFNVEIPVNRAEKRYYSLHKKTEWGGTYAIICDTTVKDTSKIVTIRGLVQIVNHLKIPVDVYSMSNSGDSVVMIGTVEREKPFNVPVQHLYTKTGELFFAPKGYNVSSMPYVWTTLMKDLEGVFRPMCRPKEENKSEFHVKLIGEVKQTLHEGTNRKTLASQCCYIHLKSPLVINNLLPVKLAFSLHNKLIGTAEKGHSVQVTELEIGQKEEFNINFKLPDYEGLVWRSEIRITKDTPELSPWQFTSDSPKEASMFLGIHKDETDDLITLHVYCPFWMINRTGLNLAYEAEDQPKDTPPIIHPASREEPVLFAFRGKSFFARKKTLVRINGKSDWSTKFSVDVAGSCGSVICKSPTQDYEIGVEIVLSGWGLTKSVIFTPRYYLINQCSFRLQIFEKEKRDSHVALAPRKCLPFWRKDKTPQCVAQIDGTPEFTKPFSYEKADQILLQLPNKFAGVHVDVHITEGSHVITFSEFVHGQAAVYVVNHTPDNIIEFSEKGTELTRVIPPNKNQLITWHDPMGEKTISWSPFTYSGKKYTFTDKLEGDGYGSYKWTTQDGREVEYDWVSFLDGLQRVLLFTSDRSLVSYLQTARDTEAPTADYTLMLHGLGLSLCNNATYTEIMYLRIASSEIAWESQKEGKRQRFKPLKYKQSSAIEVAYQNYMNEKVINPTTKSRLCLDAGIELDFVDMKMFKPYERTIRRVFQTGIWMHYKAFPHTVQLHAKLYRIQIDNQLADCIFRTILAPVPPPRSVSLDDDIPKPFAEVSVMQRMTAHSSVIQFKYFKVLIQEFLVRLDITFVNAMVELFSESGEQKLERMVEYFVKDYEEANTSLDEFLARHIVSQGQKNFYDYLHFSPLKIHLSFSMGGATRLTNSFLSLLIASLGVSVTEVQDVVFKLACMELQHMFLTGTQLYEEAYSHYTSQGIRQLYVLVFGLDVIGNPYGLFVGFTQGVGAFFYEPFHGAIQGPGEFAEGLALGVKSLVGHTIGGMSGAFSKITGTFGKGVAALTLDDEYQRKRRENISKRHTAAEGFVESGKDLVMGVVDGISGVFTKPFKGAKADGVEGFFKGLGKGAIGLVVRPTAGVIDFTSGSFDAVKKAVSVSEDIQRMRPPRYIPTDTVLLPYILHEAEGMFLLNELEKGKYIRTDSYIAHALINPHGVYVFLLTNKRIFYIKRVDIFGGWGIQWTYLWEQLAGPPDVVERGLSFRLKPRERRTLLRCNERTEMIVPLYSADVCTWMLNKIETAMRTETGVVAHSAESDENMESEKIPLLDTESTATTALAEHGAPDVA